MRMRSPLSRHRGWLLAMLLLGAGHALAEGPDIIANIASVTSGTPDPTPGDTSSSAGTLLPSTLPPMPSPTVIPADARWATVLLALALLLGAGLQLRRRG